MATTDGVTANAWRIHQETLVVAMHTDLIGDVAERHSWGEHRVLRDRHAGIFRRAGIRCICDHVIGDTFETQCFPSKDLLFGLYGERAYNPSRLKHSMKILEYMLADLDESHEDFALARSVAEIRRTAGSGRIAVVLSTQGLTPIEDEPALLHVYHRLGVRVLGLTVRSGSNAAVGNSSSDLGLTNLGRAILQEAQQLRMVIDVSSVSRRAFWEILELIQGPVVASLSNARAVCDDDANLDDDQIRAIAAKGGVIGVIANARTVTRNPNPTLSHYIDHIDHIVNLVGASCVGIGPDLVEDSWYPIETYRRMFADVGYWKGAYPAGLRSVADLPNLTASLLERGYAEKDINNILGGNVLRVYEQIWGG